MGAGCLSIIGYQNLKKNLIDSYIEFEATTKSSELSVCENSQAIYNVWQNFMTKKYTQLAPILHDELIISVA